MWAEFGEDSDKQENKSNGDKNSDGFGDDAWAGFESAEPA